MISQCLHLERPYPPPPNLHREARKAVSVPASPGAARHGRHRRRSADTVRGTNHKIPCRCQRRPATCFMATAYLVIMSSPKFSAARLRLRLQLLLRWTACKACTARQFSSASVEYASAACRASAAEVFFAKIARRASSCSDTHQAKRSPCLRKRALPARRLAVRSSATKPCNSSTIASTTGFAASVPKLRVRVRRKWL